ncbi:MAG: CAAX prenyl protease-related protein [Kiritimatiellaeota bacterium]|nr:CAAX prenyl protease-related protein [Kiritimatiellota bacterium]
MQRDDKKLFSGHVAPFALWVGVIFLLQALETLDLCPRALYPWSYAVKAAVCAGLFLWLRPWRVYPALKRSNVPLALTAGVVVTVAWILPETPWLGRAAPGLQAFYHRWCIMMPGTFPNYYNPDIFPALPPSHASLAFSPQEAGWPLTIMKLIGSAGVIAVIEEFFFRGFFCRWLRQGKFWAIPLTSFDLQAFMATVAVFGLEHDRWLAGMFAGAVYGWLALRTGDIWSAALAHGLTNALLAVYVILSGQYGFW